MPLFCWPKNIFGRNRISGLELVLTYRDFLKKTLFPVQGTPKRISPPKTKIDFSKITVGTFSKVQ